MIVTPVSPSFCFPFVYAQPSGLSLMGHANSTLPSNSFSSGRIPAIERPQIAAKCDDLTLRLHDNCLDCIFQKLSVEERNVCSLVCKRWHYVESKTRNRLTLKACQSLDAVLIPLFTRFEFISCLSLKCNRNEMSIDDYAIFLVGLHCKSLTKLKLKSCKSVTDFGIGEFARVCTSLTKFSCSSCVFGAKGLNMLLKSSPRLVDLSVTRLHGLLNDPEAILPGASQIQRLSLKEILNAHLFGTVITGSKCIRTLSLVRNPGLWDPFFELVSGHLSELVELRLDTLHIGDAALMAISSCSKLQVFHVSRVSDCSDYGYSAIASGCRNLRKLYVDHRRTGIIGDEGLLTFGKYSTELQELVLIGTNVSIKSMTVIASNCLKLERLALCNSETVGDTELFCIAEKCWALRKLCIKSCPISDNGLKAFAGDVCPSLKKLKVKKCKDVTAESTAWLEMNRVSLVVSLDAPTIQAAVPDGRVAQGEVRVIRSATSLFCKSFHLSKSRVRLATGKLIRQFVKQS
ncbi:hypothetical protein KP509_01G026600 [Ceratopteris richardii]|uniref:F-box domain-containing protein n=1 Tax=Ceratopteris richardii TaxID=49495 RepID=A0A8T2VIC6_CERRI|nr:hypothetical protein KP509_01G026600 [Ceratopteris richardii]KAH7445855.1 hypothetical protein KP509_01G026600 [Ceratopteris richardii]